MRSRGLVLGIGLLLGCGASSKAQNEGAGGTRFTGSTASASSGAGGAGTGGSAASGIGVGGNSFNRGPVVSLAIAPTTASLDVMGGATAQQVFTATATYQDGSTGPADGVTWSATNLAVGSIDGNGTFTASGMQGGSVQVTATVSSRSAQAMLGVTLHVVDNAGGVDKPTQMSLQGATTQDPSVVLAYPYAQMTYPRGIAAPSLMWNNGAASDTIFVHLTSPNFELLSFKQNVSGRYDFDPTVWQEFAQSTAGDAHMTIARFASGAATVIADQHWTIAGGAMRGTIYYWAISTGRVMRIKPGSTFDDFLGPSVTCPSCHTVSANGSRLVMNEGDWPNETSFSYNLGTAANDYSGLATSNGASQWALPGISADGSVVVQNFAPLRGPIGVQTGAFDAVTGAQLPPTGLENTQLKMPAFSPDDRLLAYVDANSGDLHAFDWDPIAKQAKNNRVIVAAGSDTTKSIINAPTVSPDHQWIIYQRSNGLGSLGLYGNLYIASVAQPGTEAPLDNLNGTTYPFAAGMRDQDLSYEPTFAPVAAGGYFWVVFHSRRTYGNVLTGPPWVYDSSGNFMDGGGVKQLWVAAIDQAPIPGQDPSHPAFWLPGQDTNTLNMRGYWALPPCAADGMGCTSGTDCCGGYCDSSGDSGMPVCKSTSSNGCSSVGDHCTTSGDCCDTKALCINSVCSEPTPQ